MVIKGIDSLGKRFYIMIHRSRDGYLDQSSLVLKYLEGFGDRCYITGNDSNPRGFYTAGYISPVIMRVIPFVKHHIFFLFMFIFDSVWYM